MSEFESLVSEEPLEEHVRRHNFDRLVMLSDGIFAIATTLAAIEIKVPEHTDDLRLFVHELLLPILTYFLSFALIGQFWLQNRNLFARITHVDRTLTFLTLMLLCAVALIPSATHEIYLASTNLLPFRFYLVVMAICGTLNFASWLYVSFRPAIMKPDVPREEIYKRLLNLVSTPLLTTPLIFIPLERGIFVFGAILGILNIAGLALRRRFPKRKPATRVAETS